MITMYDKFDCIQVLNPITGAVRDAIVWADMGARIMDASGRIVHKSNIMGA